MAFTFSFNWDRRFQKPTASILFGLSPELEIALYTLCFYTRPGQECSVNVAGRRFPIQTNAYGKKLRGAFFRLAFAHYKP